jgi:DNA polymerase family A/AAA domain
LDATINNRGIHVDVHLANAAIRIADIVDAEINAELAAVTGGAVPAVTQVPRLTKWLADQGCTFKNVGKETLARALAGSDLKPVVRRAIELRLDGAHASANKFKTMLAWRNTDGRIRGALQYHGASTGRWSSHGVQLQNLKRPVAEDLGAAIEAVTKADIDHLRSTYLQPMSVLGDVTRATICAKPGHILYAADYSGIEARMLAWLATESRELKQWAKFDESHDAQDEPYLITGQALGLDRDKGKTATLAFGYMGGVGAYRRLAKDDPATDGEVKRRQQAWRAGHPATVKFWGDINRAAISAVQNRGRTYKAGRYISFHWGEDDFLRMTLPSGRELAYPFPSLFCDPRGELAVVFKDSQAGQWLDCRKGKGAYGGTWTENAVQAASRDLLVAAMPRLEAAGYAICLHVHDEIIAEVPEGFGSEEEFLRLVTALPDWAAGLPVAAKFRAGARLCKIKPIVVDELPDDSIQSILIEAEGVADEPREPHDPEPEVDSLFHIDEELRDDDNTRKDFDNTEEDTSRYSGDGCPNGEAKASYGPSYIYLDRDGNFYSRATRRVDAYGKKTFRQSRWENGKWVPKAPAIKIPYRLPELVAAPGERVYICEGEKDADSVAALGLIATTNPGGGIKGAWTSDLNKWFAVRAIFILEDNDSTGRAHADEVASALKPIAQEIRIVSFPDVPEREDVSYWLAQGHTKKELIARAKAGRLPSKGYELVRASDVLPRNVDWLWDGYLPRNALEILAGLPGAGKSQIHCQFVACATTGRKQRAGSVQRHHAER